MLFIRNKHEPHLLRIQFECTETAVNKQDITGYQSCIVGVSSYSYSSSVCCLSALEQKYRKCLSWPSSPTSIPLPSLQIPWWSKSGVLYQLLIRLDHHKTNGCQHINLIVTQMEFDIYVTTKSIHCPLPLTVCGPGIFWRWFPSLYCQAGLLHRSLS